MTFSATQLAESLQQEHKMECKVYPLGQDATFFGSELGCYKMAYKFKNKENRVGYSENLKKHYVSFPKWFNLEFSQKIA